MYKLADAGVSVNLTVSLHEPFDAARKDLMPIANKYSVKEILDACSYYFEKTGRRYIFEYSLVRNLIRLNEVKERNLLATTDKNAYSFLGLLEKGGLSATVRRQIGADIDGACGQLRAKYLNNGENFWKE